MRICKIGACVVVFVSLLGFLGCRCKEVAQITAQGQVCTLTIANSKGKCSVTTSSNCATDTTDSQTLLVHAGVAEDADKVIWKSSDATYSIDFPISVSFPDGKTPFRQYGKPITSISSDDNRINLVTGDPTCLDGHPRHQDDCDFKYSMTQEGVKDTCSDPKVRVIPNVKVSLFTKLWSWLSCFF